MKKIVLLLFLVIFNLTSYAQNLKTIYKQAMQHHEAGKYAEAVKLYTKVINKDSLFEPAWLNRGLCYLSLNQPKKMISDFEFAVYIEPTDTFAIAKLADAYSGMGDYQKAIYYFQKNRSLGYIFTYDTYGDFGSSYYFSGQNDSARKYLQMSYDLNNTYVLAINNLAWANLDYNPNKSCLLFHEAYMMDSLEVRNINNLGYSHLLCGNLDEGFALISRAEKLDPTNSFVYRNYGLYYMKKNNKTLACKNLQKAIDLKIIEDWGQSYIAELITYCR